MRSFGKGNMRKHHARRALSMMLGCHHFPYKKEAWMRRALHWCLLAVGVVFMAAGIVLVTKSATGNTPISLTAYVVNVAHPSISYGLLTFIWNMLLLLAQLIILRKEFKAISLLQIPISALFGESIDVFNGMLAWFVPQNYIVELIVLALGIASLAFGVACTVVANVAMNSGEALVAAIACKTNWNFGHTKVGFDISCVIIACIISYVTMGHLVGVREGTLAAAALTGFAVNFFISFLNKVIDSVPIRDLLEYANAK